MSVLNHSYFPNKKNVISFPVYLRKVQIAPAHRDCPLFLKLVSLCVILCFPCGDGTHFCHLILTVRVKMLKKKNAHIMGRERVRAEVRREDWDE